MFTSERNLLKLFALEFLAVLYGMCPCFLSRSNSSQIPASPLIPERIEARGFTFGPFIALAIRAKYVPLRKPRKLPGKVYRQEYDLEYRSDCLVMLVRAVEPRERALVVDDLIATGGTLCATMNLLGAYVWNNGYRDQKKSSLYSYNL